VLVETLAKSGVASRNWTKRKQRNVDRIVQFIGWLLFAASCLGWFFYSVPLWVFICLSMTPWLALALVTFGRGRFLLLGPDDRTVLNIVICVPLGLMAGALLRFDVIDWKWGLMIACLGGTLFLAGYFIAVRSTPRRRARTNVHNRATREWVREMFLILFIGFVGVGLSWATIVFINGLWEAYPPTKLSGKVVGKSISGGKSHSYFLRFSGQPTMLGMESFRVSRARYDRTRIGQADCVIVHSGLLGLRYYDVIDC